MIVLYSCVALTGMIHSVMGHGHLTSPRSRNYDAAINGAQNQAGVPPIDYCPHCLNNNHDICGYNNYNDYDDFRDGQGNPMPWISMAEYRAGDIIDVESYLDTHHNGHMEIRACAADANGDFSLECINTVGNELIFVDDPKFGMPADPDYPERGYYFGGQGGSEKAFHMRFKLPDGLKGEKVLLQWKYITANSCSPPGYAKYFTDNMLSPSFWTQGVAECSPPYPSDGTRSSVWPEQFFNCASITIIDPVPTTSPNPTSDPTSAPPTNTDKPSKATVQGPTWGSSSNGITLPCCGWTKDAGCEQPDNAWCHAQESQCTGACSGTWYTSGNTPGTPSSAPQATPTYGPLPTMPTTKVPTAPGQLFSTSTTMSSYDVLMELSTLSLFVSQNPPIYALQSAGGAAGNGNVVTESQAYGMLISAIVLGSWDTHSAGTGADWNTAVRYFEGYFNGWKKMCINSSGPCQSGAKWCYDESSNTNGVCLPGWKHAGNLQYELESGAAPDGDEDAIVGMIIALKAFDTKVKPSFYNELRKWADASATSFLFHNTKVHSSSPSHRILKLGSCWGGFGGEGNNPSYHSPGSFKVMRDFHIAFPNAERSYTMPNLGPGTLESHWNNLIDTSYKVLKAMQCPTQGMVPNWATVDLLDGKMQYTGGTFSGSGTPQWEYGAEAARTTWRVTLDALLYPDEMYVNAEPYLNPLLARLNDGYNPNSPKAFQESTFTTCQLEGGLGDDVYSFSSGWLWSGFIYAPTVSALVVPIPGISEPNQQAILDFVGSNLAANIPGEYYPRCWTLIGILTLNGSVESVGNLLAGSPESPGIVTTGVPCCSNNFKDCISWSCNGCNESEEACLAESEQFFWMPWGEVINEDSCIAITYSCVGHGKPCCPGMECDPTKSSGPCIPLASQPSVSPLQPRSDSPVSSAPTPIPTLPTPATAGPALPLSPAPTTRSPTPYPVIPPTPYPVIPPTPYPVVIPTPSPITPTRSPTLSPTPAPVGGATSNGIPLPCCGWNGNGCEQPGNTWCHAQQSQCTGACNGKWYSGGGNAAPTPPPVNTGSGGCCTWGGWSTCPQWTQSSSDPCQKTQTGCQNCWGSWIIG